MESVESGQQDDLPAQPGTEPSAENQRRNASPTPEQSKTNVGPIVFIDHTNKRFVFPFESCRTWDLFKTLLEKTYTRASKDARDAILEEKYDLLTIDDEIILPAVWEHVIENHLPWQRKNDTIWRTIKISLWPENQDSESSPSTQLTIYRDVRGRRSSFLDREEIIFRRGGSSTRSRSNSIDHDRSRGRDVAREDSPEITIRENSHTRRRSRPRKDSPDIVIQERSSPKRRSRSRSRSGSRGRQKPRPPTGGGFVMETSPSPPRRRSPPPPQQPSRNDDYYTDPLPGSDYPNLYHASPQPVSPIRPDRAYQSTMPRHIPRRPSPSPSSPPPPPPRPGRSPPESSPPERVRFTHPAYGWDEEDEWYDVIHINDDSSISSEDEESVPEPEKEEEPTPRNIETPRDKDGNKLLFYTETKWPIARPAKTDPGKLPPALNMKVDTLKITKAVQVAMDNRMSVQLHTLPGPPESGSISASINIRWIHLHGDNLDFAQFRTACLNVPDLPERIQRLASKTLDRIEKEKLKMALDGMFIDPGTVLRGEEKHRPDPFSVIFSCVPYFSIHAPSKSAPPKADRLHPVRSLMQSYYPYEPVKERDMEQAYRKFSKYTTAPGSSGSSNSIIHVPVLWILNLGDRAVVTCGPQSLAEDFVKSITVMQEDLKLLSLGSQQTPGSSSMNDITNIRLLIPDGRVLLYSLAECETYFEMEQKIREISPLPGITKPLLVWNHDEGEDDTLISSADWPALLKTRNRIFINLTLVKEYKPNGSDTSPATNMTVSGIPPFFHWPHAEKKVEANATDLGSQQYGFIPAEMKLSMHCLEQVEKGLMAEKLDYKDVETVVERNFTSNRYYQTLPENKLEDIRTNFVSLLQSTTILGIESSDRTFHQNIVNKQCSDLTKHAAELVDIVYETIKLFVSDVDKGTMLRKVWGAMTNVSTLIEQVQRRGPCRPDAKEFDDTRWIPPLTNEPAWYIRTAKDSLQRGKFVSLPVDEKVEESLKKCRSCRRGTPHISSGSALRHLRVHIREGSTAPAVNGTAQNQDKEPNLKDWIRNADQRLIEETNAAYLAILIPVVEQARGLLVEARELANGVKTIEGKMSDIYFLPHELLKTLRRLIVFYLAVERAFHYTDENFEKFRQMQRLLRVQREDDIPSSAKGLNVLERFGTDAKNSLLTARKELCMLAKAPGFQYLSQRLSLSPQYLCAWFMRRLIVRPVDSNGMTVTDMYRDYLSRLQFQVNHRPGKRLLRSLNLIQEELAALERVNQWQSRLINSYCTVLDDSFYQFNVPSRRAMFAYERQLLSSCLENLADARDDCAELIRRCGPLSESTKQSAEINEEDHGKAILVFTVVTIIFLPLSFVTSYLGMNTSDIRDMENKQSLFWQIALPLTAVTMGTMLFIAYNGEDLRRHISSAYRKLLGKQDTNVNSHGISVAQRRRASRVSSDSTSTFDYRSLADEAEFTPPRPVIHIQSFPIRESSGPYGTQNPAELPIEIDYTSPAMVEARSSLPTYRSPVPISGLNSIPPTPPVIINTAVPGSRNSYSYLSPPPPPPEPRTSDSIMGEVPISRIAVVPIQDPQITSNALQSDYPPPPEYPGRTGPSDEYTWVRSSNRTRDKSRSVHASRERDPYAAAYEYTDSYRPRHRTESYDRSAERRMRETLGARHSVRPGVTIYRNERGERDREGERNVERDRMRDAYSYSPQVYDYRERSRGSRY